MYSAYLRGNVFIEDNLGVGKINPAYNIETAGDIKTWGTLHCYALDVYSDATKKENIRSLDKGNLQKLSNLNAVSFTYKAPEEKEMEIPQFSDTGQVVFRKTPPLPDVYSRPQIGFLAQELQQVFPELVSEDKEGTLGINYIGLIPVLVEALKEQEEAIEKLRGEISSLKALSGRQ